MLKNIKWMAVDRPELRHYTDVILISVKGARRGADWLGGGKRSYSISQYINPMIIQVTTTATKLWQSINLRLSNFSKTPTRTLAIRG